MRKLIYQGYVLTNSQGATDSWELRIGQEHRQGSLFELKRLVDFYVELKVLPQVRVFEPLR
ncbi:DUF3319 domain-containing protein [Shewanella sp. NIFS-20-20]|uniref:DUF3319 domain-containing protein n=1 Tax=Shewanella sp. NIFS-20-20 TaxID=2853806 RepID=UPI001C481BB9|nr:DUF3319 domain-containing protein [Shewanella sp. NIFS-20-20]MBV7316734.1 DUF3319 domain-containing protein [Shewanella sp. NIFS-20-20]